MPIGRSRWKLPFGRSSAAAPSSPAASVGIGSTPMSFVCPISSSLMADPVIIPTGHTFERACIEACRDFNFTPPSLITSSSSNIDDYFSSSSSSSSLIPNAALRAAIFDWCDHAALPHPSPLSRESARALVQNLISNSKSPPPPKFQQQIAEEIQIEEEEEEEEEDYANKNKNKQQQQQQFSSPPSNSSSCSTCSTSSFSSSERDQVHLTTTTTTTTTAHSSSASSSNNITSSSSSSDPLEESILIKLKSSQISVKESGLITLRQSARESSDSRISLCTPRILAALVPLILVSSNNNNNSTNATAALVNLSIEHANKVKIVRSGAIPPLVEALKKSGRYCEEARYNAAGALFSLSLEDENKLAIGVLGAIPPLINLFCQESAGDVARVEAGMALYHLSLAPNNLSKIAKTPGAVKAILNMAVAATATAKGEIESSEETATRMLCLRLRRVGMMVLASLARRNEGRVALMDADAVKAMVGLMMESAAAGREEEDYYLAVMYEMSKGKGSLRFRALARAAGAERVLLQGDDDARGEVGKEMARRILKVIRGDNEERGVYSVVMMQGDEEEEEEEEVASVVSDGLVLFRRRRYDDFGGTSATNSANF